MPQPALFKLKLHRGEGMLLIAMNWLNGTPPDNFVGFAIEYAQPGSQTFYDIKNRLAFSYPPAGGDTLGGKYPTKDAPIQKFRWVHFPYRADLPGLFTYRVTPVFMDAQDVLSYGTPVEAHIDLATETYPGKLNVAFTRGYIASQSFVRAYDNNGGVKALLPSRVGLGMSFTPTHPKRAQAYEWMGFESRREILKLLNAAVADPTAQVSMVAYDFNLPEVVDILKQLGPRLRLIVDDSDDHDKASSAEPTACTQIIATAGAANVKRQHMGHLQHNKLIIVDGAIKAVVCGSTNFSWNGFFVQSNNALILTGAAAIVPFQTAFNNYWTNAAGFQTSAPTRWTPVPLPGIDMQVSFSPHSAANAILDDLAQDIASTTSSLFYSLAFLYLSPKGPVARAISAVSNTAGRFVYGMSDKSTAIIIQKPDGNPKPVYYKTLSKLMPKPFKPASGANGIHLHHKFVVIDFDKPTARVYTGSHNFSGSADVDNGENLVLIKDARVATAFMVEALRLFDHYHFTIATDEAQQAGNILTLKKPPRQPGDVAWWQEHYSDAIKIRDRELFCP